MKASKSALRLEGATPGQAPDVKGKALCPANL